MKWGKHTIFVLRKTGACIYRKIFDYFTFGAVIQFTIRISCKRVRIWPRYWVYFYYRNPKSGRDLRPRVYGGTWRFSDDGEERDDHANGVMIKTKKIPRTGGETENKSSEAKFIPKNSMLNFWTVKPGLKNESNVTPVRCELLKQYLLVYDWLSQPFCVVVRLRRLQVVSYYYFESQ